MFLKVSSGETNWRMILGVFFHFLYSAWSEAQLGLKMFLILLQFFIFGNKILIFGDKFSDN